MQSKDNFSEENIKRLIQQSIEPRPDTALRRQVFDDIVSTRRTPSTGNDFPTLSLFVLSGMLLSMAALLLCWYDKTVATYMTGIINSAVVSILFLNILFIPLSGITIVIRRQKSK